MRQGWLAVALVAVAPSAWALTAEELSGADLVLRQMDGVISEMRGCLQESREGKLRLIDVALSQEQRNAYEDCYETNRARLASLLRLLPQGGLSP